MPDCQPSDAAIERGELAAALARVLGGEAGRPGRISAVAGGCIDTARIVDIGERRVFVKIAADRTRLEAEADGLSALAKCTALRVPQVLGIEDLDGAGRTVLVLEYLSLSRQGDEAALGHAVAELHRQCGPAFGWGRDNFIGATPQRNGWSDDWPAFFVDRRLRPQLRWAVAGGAAALAPLAEALLAAVPALLADRRPPASLLHGDLWRGNVGFVAGQPALFDPATHYGDHEADLAMSELFGGFPARFYAAYREVWPPVPGYERRRDLYALYHILNHFNLFGGAYAEQARRLIVGLLGDRGHRPV